MHYNTAQSLSIKKEKKTIHIYTKNKLKQTEAKTKFTHPHTPCSLVQAETYSDFTQASKIEFHANKT